MQRVSPVFHQLMHKLGAKEQWPLAPYSTLKVGGPARYFLLSSTLEDIASAQRACRDYGISLHVLSGGSNTLFSDDGFPGLVVKLSPHFDYIKQTQATSFSAGAATSFAKITKLAISLGWSGAIGWCGTPGLIGGAIRMNAGTRLGEIGQAINAVHGVIDGRLETFKKNDLTFSYRHSNLPHDFIICSADFLYSESKLEPVDKLLISVQENTKKRKLSQPSTNSLGSFFKNPYPAFAAQLIENCNLKGLKYKSAQISPLHANFIINNGGATAKDILHIAEIAKRSVFENFGILLKPEVRMVGSFDGFHEW